MGRIIVITVVVFFTVLAVIVCLPLFGFALLTSLPGLGSAAIIFVIGLIVVIVRGLFFSPVRQRHRPPINPLNHTSRETLMERAVKWQERQDALKAEGRSYSDLLPDAEPKQ